MNKSVEYMLSTPDSCHETVEEHWPIILFIYLFYYWWDETESLGI
jgi:hypothetical protein